MKDLISKYLPGILQALFNSFDPKLAGKKKIKATPKDYDYLKYLVNVRYNQRVFAYGQIDLYTTT